MARIPMTIEGAERLKSELKRLKTVERPAVMHALAEARSHGDISENADYDAAKNEQGHNEARIRQLEAMLKNAREGVFPVERIGHYTDQYLKGGGTAAFSDYYQVEQEQAIAPVPQARQTLAAVRRRVDGVALRLQQHVQHLHHMRVILHHEDVARRL